MTEHKTIERVNLVDAFEMGRAWERRMSRPQVTEDSRAVGRELAGSEFEAIAAELRVAERELGFNPFTPADEGIAQALAILHAALNATRTNPAEGE